MDFDKKFLEFMKQPRGPKEIAKMLGISLEEVEKLSLNQVPGYKLFTFHDSYGRPLRALLPDSSPKEMQKPVWSSYKVQDQPWLLIQMPDNVSWRKIKVYLFGDFHGGATGHNPEGFDECIQLVAEKNHAFAILNGDILELALASSIPGAVYEQTMRPREQIEFYREKLRPIAHKILVCTPGNHERRVIKLTDIDPLKIGICDPLGIPYIDEPVYLDILWKEQAFRFFVQHGKSGALTEGGKMNAAARPLSWNDFTHFTIMGHVHTPMADRNIRRIPEEKYDEDGNLVSFKMTKKEEFIVIISSTYRYFTTYAAREGYKPGPSELVMACQLEADGRYHLEKKELLINNNNSNSA